MSVDILQMLIATLVGSISGTFIGMIPGLGPTAGIAILIPLILDFQPHISLPFIAAVYYGTQYGGSTTAILFKIPGESSSIVVCQDGNNLYKQGRGGAALTVAAVGSFIAGLITCVLVYVFAPYLAKLSLYFRPVEIFSLTFLGILLAAIIFNKDKLLAFYSTVLGILLSCIGANYITGVERFTHDILYLFDGFSFVVVIAGLLGGPEIIKNIVGKDSGLQNLDIKTGLGVLNIKEKLSNLKAVLRGTSIGSLFGLIPGGGGTVSSFFAYSFEKFFTKDLGSGKLEGVTVPESANNAAVQTAFIPLLALGIPENTAMALIFGLMIQQGVLFGPVLFETGTGFINLLIMSMFLGNCMLLIFNLPMIKYFVKVYQVPQKILFSVTGILLLLSVYYNRYQIIDVYLLLFFSCMGLVFKKYNIPVLPLLIGFILGPMFEDRMLKALIFSNGDYMLFLTNWISLTIFSLFILFYVSKTIFLRMSKS